MEELSERIIFCSKAGGAIGEYTGVKPNEFMTLDKTALESSGQIMYDQFSTMTMGRNTSCSTLGRGLNHNPTGKPVVSNGYDGPMDYETGMWYQQTSTCTYIEAKKPQLLNYLSINVYAYSGIIFTPIVV